MQEYNLIAVFSKDADKMLMCRRRKNPYKGLSQSLCRMESKIRCWKVFVL